MQRKWRYSAGLRARPVTQFLLYKDRESAGEMFVNVVFGRERE